MDDVFVCLLFIAIRGKKLCHLCAAVSKNTLELSTQKVHEMN